MPDRLSQAAQALDLPKAHQEQLRSMIEDARQQQATELAAAMDGALDFVPRLLRGPIKKLFAT